MSDDFRDLSAIKKKPDQKTLCMIIDGPTLAFALAEEKQANAFIQVTNGHYGYKLARRYDKTTLLNESDEYFNINLMSDTFEEDYLILPSQGLATYKWNLGA